MFQFCHMVFLSCAYVTHLLSRHSSQPSVRNGILPFSTKNVLCIGLLMMRHVFKCKFYPHVNDIVMGKMLAKKQYSQIHFNPLQSTSIHFFEWAKKGSEKLPTFCWEAGRCANQNIHKCKLKTWLGWTFQGRSCVLLLVPLHNGGIFYLCSLLVFLLMQCGIQQQEWRQWCCCVTRGLRFRQIILWRVYWGASSFFISFHVEGKFVTIFTPPIPCCITILNLQHIWKGNISPQDKEY